MMSVVALCPPEMIVMRCREALGLDGIIMMVPDRRA